MKIEDIKAACVYLGSSHGMGSARMVDRIYSRHGKQVWVDWAALSAGQRSHLRQGSMTIEAFAKWAKVKEPPTEKDLETHRMRVSQAARTLGLQREEPR